MIGIHVEARRKLLKGAYIAFDLAVLVSVMLLAGLFYVHVYGQHTVSRHPEKLVLQESGVVMASDGTVLRKIPLPGSGYRKLATLEEMPKRLVDTFLAVEDRRFYRHQGLDYQGIARALLNNTLHMRVSEGGSSITQQLARNLYLNRKQTLLRKLNEASIALALEKRLSKHDILEMYLNQIYMGEGQYGVKAAAEHYFGVTNLKELDVAQIASLAAIPKGPSIYHPGDDAGLSVERRNLVLGIMREQGLITQEEMAAAQRKEYRPPEVYAGEPASGPESFLWKLCAGKFERSLSRASDDEDGPAAIDECPCRVAAFAGRHFASDGVCRETGDRPAEGGPQPVHSAWGTSCRNLPIKNGAGVQRVCKRRRVSRSSHGAPDPRLQRERGVRICSPGAASDFAADG